MQISLVSQFLFVVMLIISLSSHKIYNVCSHGQKLTKKKVNRPNKFNFAIHIHCYNFLIVYHAIRFKRRLFLCI